LVKVHFYGRLAEAIGPEVDIDPSGDRSVDQLREMLCSSYPQAAVTLANRRSRVCVNDALVDESYVIQPTDRLDFLSPVSGG
jgi:sulfur-carrier protein